jgi:hypothetical protein
MLIEVTLSNDALFDATDMNRCKSIRLCQYGIALLGQLKAGAESRCPGRIQAQRIVASLTLSRDRRPRQKTSEFRPVAPSPGGAGCGLGPR